MTATALPSEPSKEQHATFFRQSGWMMMASIAGGMLTWGVHFLSKRIPESQYSIFGVLLMVTACLPTMPLQMLFAQQTATAYATDRKRQLAGMLRLGSLWIFVAWLFAAAVVLFFQDSIASRWGLTNNAALWITLLTVLVALWTPVLTGTLQGRQDFLWLGWIAILTGVFRVGLAAVLVLGFAGGATSMMIGTLAGMAIGVAIIAWRTRDLWTLPRERFDGKGLLKQILPVVLAFWAFQFMFTSDTMYAKAFFSGDEMAPYFAAGTLSRALLWLVLPLAAVMFPKLVHSAARAEKSNLLSIVLLGTGILALCGCLGLWILGPWVIKLVYPARYVAATTALLPWYMGAMVPLALANVLVNDLMARARFRVVPWIVLLAIAYGFTLPYVLNHYPRRLETVLQILAVYNVLLLAVCAIAAFVPGKKSKVRPVV